MPKTVQIRDLDDDLYAALVRRAAESGSSVPELLREEIRRLVARPSMATWLEQTRRLSHPDITGDDVLDSLDRSRGAWPDDAGR